MPQGSTERCDRSGVLLGFSAPDLSSVLRLVEPKDDEGDEDDGDQERSRREQNGILERLRQLQIWQNKQQSLLVEQQRLILQRLREEQRGCENDEVSNNQEDLEKGSSLSSTLKEELEEEDEEEEEGLADDDDGTRTGSTESQESGISRMNEDNPCEDKVFRPDLTDITEEGSVLHDSIVRSQTDANVGQVGVESLERHCATESVLNSCFESSVIAAKSPGPLSLDDVPINSKIGESVRNFEELVELQLRQDNHPNKDVKDGSSSLSGKRPFLKRGEGLERYKISRSRASSRRPSVSSATSSGYHSSSSTNTASSSTSVQPSRSLNLLEPTADKEGSLSVEGQVLAVAPRKPGPKVLFTNKTPALTGFHKSVVERDLRDKELARDIAEQKSEVKVRKVASLSKKSSPSLLPPLPPRLAMKREAAPRVLATSTGEVHVAVKSKPGIENCRPESIKEILETTLEKSIQNRRQDKQAEESLEMKEIKEFELLEQLAVAVGAQDHEMVRDLLERSKDGNNNNGAANKPFDANSYKSTDDYPDPDVLDSDAEVFGEGTESADASMMNVFAAAEVSESDKDLTEETLTVLTGGVPSLSKVDLLTESKPSTIHPAFFDDERVWDQDSCDLDLSSLAEDSRLHLAKSQSTSTPAKKSVLTFEEGDPDETQPKSETLDIGDLFPKTAAEAIGDLFPKIAAGSAPASTSPLTVVEKQEEFKIIEGELSSVVKTKLLELEREIEEFKIQNECLARLRNEKDSVVARLKEELNEFQEQKKDEAERFAEFKDAEIKRLRKDRKSFEEMQRITKEKVGKRDNEEIKNLKTHVGDLQEELQKRSARWAAASTRLRERITVLSTENEELKKEIVTLKDKAKKDLLKRHTAEKLTPAITADFNNDTKSISRNDLSRAFSSSNVRKIAAVEVSAVAKQHASIRAKASSNHEENRRGLKQEVKTAQAPARQLSPLREETESVTQLASMDATMTDNARRLSTSSAAANLDAPIEKVHDDGSKTIAYRNGTRKTISPDGATFDCHFFNGDRKTVSSDGKTVYFYAATETTHTTFPDGTESLEFANGQTEISRLDGTKEVRFLDGTVKKLHPSGNEDSIFPDGTVIHVDAEGRKVIYFPNGQKEIHEAGRKSRSYPDGTVKTVFDDGTQETKYPSGRRRLKDKDGNVVMDTNAQGC